MVLLNVLNKRLMAYTFYTYIFLRSNYSRNYVYLLERCAVISGLVSKIRGMKAITNALSPSSYELRIFMYAIMVAIFLCNI